MSDHLRKETKATTIKLGDTEYELPHCSINVLEEIEEEFQCSTTQLPELLESRMAGTLKRLLHVLLRKKYPKMTAEKIGELVDIGNLEHVSEELAKILSGEK